MDIFTDFTLVLLIAGGFVGALAALAALAEGLDKANPYFQAERRRKANARWSEIIND